MSRFILSLLGCACASVLWAAEPHAPASPKASEKTHASGYKLVLGKRQGTAEGKKLGLAHTSGATIQVTQPAPDTVIISVTGVAMAGGLPLEPSLAVVAAEIAQELKVETPRGIAGACLRMEAQLVGQLAGNRDGKGVASLSTAEGSVVLGSHQVVSVMFEPRTHAGRDSLFISDKLEPAEADVPAGCFVLGMHFKIECSHPRHLFHKNVMSAAFGANAGSPPEWLHLLSPVRDLPKQKDLGFRIALRVLPTKTPLAPR